MLSYEDNGRSGTLGRILKESVDVETSPSTLSRVKRAVGRSNLVSVVISDV
jgi:hypothetical protein